MAEKITRKETKKPKAEAKAESAVSKKKEKEERIKGADNVAIITCTCGSRYQDARYGKDRRVANYAHKAKGYRCTVCDRLHT